MGIGKEKLDSGSTRPLTNIAAPKTPSTARHSFTPTKKRGRSREALPVPHVALCLWPIELRPPFELLPVWGEAEVSVYYNEIDPAPRQARKVRQAGEDVMGKGRNKDKRQTIAYADCDFGNEARKAYKSPSREGGS